MRRETNHFSIRQVIELTGASEFLLRVWEGRYSAFKPQRTESGRRLYSADDVVKAKLLLDLTHHGHRISQLAPLSVQQLKSIADVSSDDDQTTALRHKHVLRIFSHVNSFDWDAVRKQLVPPNISSRDYLLKTLVPVALEMNRKVDQGLMSLAQEHILSALLKESVATIPARTSKSKRRARMVFATPEGDYHDLGLLIAAKIAGLQGADILMLGANVPMRDLSETCLQFKATHLVLSAALVKPAGTKSDLFKYIHFLDRTLPSTVKMWLAGRAVASRPVKLHRSYKLFDSFESFEEEFTGG